MYFKFSLSITSLGAKRRYWITKDGLNKAIAELKLSITIKSFILYILTPLIERNINYGIEGAAFNPAAILIVIAEESVNVMPIKQSGLGLRIDSFWI